MHSSQFTQNSAKIAPISPPPTRKEKQEEAVTDRVEPVAHSSVVQQELSAHDFTVAQLFPAPFEPGHRRKCFVHREPDVLEIALDALHLMAHFLVLRLHSSYMRMRRVVCQSRKIFDQVIHQVRL